MKTKLFNIIALIAIIGFSPAYSQDVKNERGQEPKFKKQKSYTKSYNVSSGDRITLENQFGEMKLVTWDKNEVKVDVSITGSSDEEARAQQIVDRISIRDEKNSSGVSFKTKFADDNDDMYRNRNDNKLYSLPAIRKSTHSKESIWCYDRS